MSYMLREDGGYLVGALPELEGDGGIYMYVGQEFATFIKRRY
jgi:hypothetical protein